MAVLPQSELQARLFAILNGDADLATLLGGSNRVFDQVPDNTEFPYVTLGEALLLDWDSHTWAGFQGEVSVHTWSRADGRLQAQNIMKRIYALLHSVDLAIAGFKTISFRQTSAQVVRDPDGKTHHGISKFNFILGG
jgi:hypothetical protein